jgi:hypothetical protein
MPRIREKVSPIIKTYIWFYRIISITFGGITINSNQKISINRYLKYYGYFATILTTLFNIFSIYLIFNSKTLAVLYNFDSILLYIISIIANVLQIIYVSANLWFLNRNGIKFFEIFYNYEIEFNRNQIILFIIWIFHILQPIGLFIYSISSDIYGVDKGSFGFITIMAIVVFRTYTFIGNWAVSFLNWIISIHFYQFLMIIENNLKLRINWNSGICFYFRL